jgi:NAD+-dependent secondary alcohol dehydrogenase Adh1
MKAARLHRYYEDYRDHYDELLPIEEVEKPQVTRPDDVLVRIGGAGLCRTDLHIIEGIWKDKTRITLPYTPGHENAGWVEDVGSLVTTVQPGDAVICHPVTTDGVCWACRRGEDQPWRGTARRTLA